MNENASFGEKVKHGIKNEINNAAMNNPLSSAINLGSAAVGGISSLINTFSGNKAAEQNYDLQLRQMEQNQANWQKQFEYNQQLQEQTWEREDNANQRAVADMRAAGLSPLANYSASNAGSVVNQSAFSQDAPNASNLIAAKTAAATAASTRSATYNQAILSNKEMQKNQLELDRMRAETDSIKANTAIAQSKATKELDLIDSQVKGNRINNENLQKQYDYSFNQIDRQIKLYDEQIAAAKTSNSHADRLATLQEKQMLQSIKVQTQNLAKGLLEMAIQEQTKTKNQYELDYYAANGWQPNVSDFVSVLNWLSSVDKEAFNNALDNIGEMIVATANKISGTNAYKKVKAAVTDDIKKIKTVAGIAKKSANPTGLLEMNIVNLYKNVTNLITGGKYAETLDNAFGDYVRN